LFDDWRRFLKGKDLANFKFLEMDQKRVGLLRENSKYCFPCDNSVIRVDKAFVGNRRIGKSIIFKDNLAFGIKERK